MAQPTPNDIDLITLNEYTNYEERSALTASPIVLKATSIAQFITQASSYAERFCDRPLVTESNIDIPTDMNGDDITLYNPFDSPITGALSPSNPMPIEIQLAVCILTRYFRFKAMHEGMAGQSDQDKTKNYDLRYFHEANTILTRYKYFKPLDRMAQDLGDDYNLQPGIDV